MKIHITVYSNFSLLLFHFINLVSKIKSKLNSKKYII